MFWLSLIFKKIKKFFFSTTIDNFNKNMRTLLSLINLGKGSFQRDEYYIIDKDNVLGKLQTDFISIND